jgi:hypothetical protein
MKSNLTSKTRASPARVKSRAPRFQPRPAGKRAAPKTARRGMVATLHLTCETTGELVAHELPSDAASVKDLWSQRLMLDCPHCRQMHGFAFRAALLRSVLEIQGAGPLRVSEQAARRRL